MKNFDILKILSINYRRMKNWVYIAIFIFVVAVVGGVIFYNAKDIDNIRFETAIASNKKNDDVIIQAKSLINQSNPTRTYLADTNCVTKILEGGYEIGIPGGKSFSSTHINIEKNEIESIFNELRELLENSGYNEDISYYQDLSELYEFSGERRGYVNEYFRCNIKWSYPTDYGSVNISCTSNLAKELISYADLKNAFDAYEPAEGYVKVDFDQAGRVCVNDVIDGYATGWVGKVSAPRWYAKKIDDEWVVTHITQDWPLCNRVEGFPVELDSSPECFYYDEKGKLQVRNR